MRERFGYTLPIASLTPDDLAHITGHISNHITDHVRQSQHEAGIP